MPWIYFNVADRFRVMGMFEVSEFLYDKSLKLYEFNLDNKTEKTEPGIVTEKKENLTLPRDREIYNSLFLMKDITPKDIASNFAKLGWLYHQKRNFDLALKLYQRSLQLYNISGNSENGQVPVLKMRMAALENMRQEK